MWAATPPATISLGVEEVKDGKISVLEGANQQSVLFACLDGDPQCEWILERRRYDQELCSASPDREGL